MNSEYLLPTNLNNIVSKENFCFFEFNVYNDYSSNWSIYIELDSYSKSIILQRGSNGTEKSNIRNLMNIHRYLARINKVPEAFLAKIPTLSLSTLTNPIRRMCQQLKKH